MITAKQRVTVLEQKIKAKEAAERRLYYRGLTPTVCKINFIIAYKITHNTL
jgi:hypothetical protein